MTASSLRAVPPGLNEANSQAARERSSWPCSLPFSSTSAWANFFAARASWRVESPRELGGLGMARALATAGTWCSRAANSGGCLRGRGGGRVELLLPLLYSRVFCFSARLWLACVSLRLQRPPPQASTWTWDRWVSGAGTSVDFSIPGKSRGSRHTIFCITSGAAYGCTPRQLTAGLRPAYRSWASTGARK